MTARVVGLPARVRSLFRYRAAEAIVLIWCRLLISRFVFVP